MVLEGNVLVLSINTLAPVHVGIATLFLTVKLVKNPISMYKVSSSWCMAFNLHEPINDQICMLITMLHGL